MTDHQVVIAGGGPTGLVLAAELALARIDVAIVERRATQDLVGWRARGLHARTIELLDQRGVADRFLAQGKTMPIVGVAMTTLDTSDMPSRHPYLLALAQERVEHTLAAWGAELGVPVYRSREVVGFAQDAAGVDVALSDGSALRAQYLVGCDGGRSVVRKTAGIELVGSDASTTYLIADVETRGEPAWGMRPTAHGMNGIGKHEDGIHASIVLAEAEVKHGEPTLDDLRATLVALYGTDFGAHSPTWLSRFSDATRHAAAYRAGRVLIAGDAAHVHSPVGGQGLNMGVFDAVNLGWKLALVVTGACPDTLLDTYFTERHPITAHALDFTMAQTALGRGDDRSAALRKMMVELLKLDEPRKKIAALLSGLDHRYDFGDGHPLLGRRMPDLELVTADGPRRVSSYLHAGRPVVLDFSVVRYDGAWELPVIGAVAAPSAVLIRPDGHVAWVGTGTDAGLREALTRWFGSPAMPT